MGKRKDMLGVTFGLLTVLAESEPSYRGNGAPIRRFICRCACGSERSYTGQNLNSGQSTTCGCVRAKHGHRRANNGADTPTYATWRAMLHRCNDPKHSAYGRYGGAGVTVCDQWSDPDTGFQTFLRDMGERPEGCTLDRRDNGKGYSPDNCRWATSREQYENKRVVRDATGKFTSNPT